MQAKLYLVRGLMAIAWAAAFATVSDSLTTGAAVLLVLYPVIDLVATVVDARSQTGRARRLLVVNAVVSAVAAVAIGVAATGAKADVLAVFGVWALLTGLAQLFLALRRRAALGTQVPMLLAGGVSALAGVVFLVMAANGTARLGILAAYAATGGLDFVIESWLLRRRFRNAEQAAEVAEVAEVAKTSDGTFVLLEVRS